MSLKDLQKWYEEETGDKLSPSGFSRRYMRAVTRVALLVDKVY